MVLSFKLKGRIATTREITARAVQGKESSGVGTYSCHLRRYWSQGSKHTEYRKARDSIIVQPQELRALRSQEHEGAMRGVEDHPGAAKLVLKLRTGAASESSQKTERGARRPLLDPGRGRINN